jgi:hypothetical protein
MCVQEPCLNLIANMVFWIKHWWPERDILSVTHGVQMETKYLPKTTRAANKGVNRADATVEQGKAGGGPKTARQWTDETLELAASVFALPLLTQ